MQSDCELKQELILEFPILEKIMSNSLKHVHEIYHVLKKHLEIYYHGLAKHIASFIFRSDHMKSFKK